MTDTNDTPRARLTTRIAQNDLAEIERLAEARRTTPAQVARVLIEDALHALGSRMTGHAACKRKGDKPMPGISKTGNKAHDDAVLAAELVLQNALAGNPTQAQVNAAHVNHFTTVRDSAIANNQPSRVFREC